jgi:hypothetical protein
MSMTAKNETREVNSRLYRKIGSAQEFDGRPILSHFPKNDEFGLESGNPLRFEEQVAQVSVSAPSAHKGFDVPVDGFYYADGHLRPTVV